jgi:hypothetical protein
MAIQLSVTLRNNRLDQVESTLGTSAKLYIRSGAQPADCATADAGSLLATLSLPSDWMNAAASGQKTLLGSWTVAASGTGTAAHFRLKDSAGTTCHLQGSISASGGGGDMELDNTSINSGQTVTVTAFTLTDANA